MDNFLLIVDTALVVAVLSFLYGFILAWIKDKHD